MRSNARWTYLLTLLLLFANTIYANGPIAFSMPNSVLLFGRHNELQIARVGRSESITPPTEVAANHGYFAYPSLSPRGDVLAWGFATKSQKDRAGRSVRFALGIFSLTARTWRIFGDFDNIGATAFSPDGSRVAFIAEQQNQKHLFVFDLTKSTITEGPYPKGVPESASLSWSPNANRLAVEIQRGEQKPLVAVLDLKTGDVQSVGEGINPSWSPTGGWIAYYDPSGAECLVVHPDGTAKKAVIRLKQTAVSYRRFGWGGPVWSPDGTQMLLDEMKGDGDYSDLVLLDVQSGHTTTKVRNGFPVFGWVTQQT